jgi:hypothetical protein
MEFRLDSVSRAASESGKQRKHMNTPTDQGSRRSFLRRAAAATAALGATLAVAPSAQAALGPSNVLTTLTVAATSARRNGTVTITVNLQRLDGRTSGLAAIPVKFHFGEGTYATFHLGTRFTDSSGRIVLRVSASTFNRVGRWVVVAEVNPSPAAENWLARPLPYAWFNITN